MKTARKWGMFTLCLVVVMALGTSGALASTITFNGDHTLTITLTRVSDSSLVYPDSGTVTSGVQGYAYNPSETNSAGESQPITIGTTTTATANGTAGTWLHTSDTNTTFSSDQTTGLFYRRFTGYGPDPSGATPGYITQSNWDSTSTYIQTIHLVFTAPTAASYSFSLQDVYDTTLALTQAGGNKVYSLDAEAYLVYYVYYSVGQQLLSSANIMEYHNDLTPPNTIPDFSNDYAYTVNANQNFNMAAGSTLTVDIALESYYEAYTVPLPSTMLLMGSGIVGLGLLRYRRKSKA
jgi:hypothetical protein